MAKLNSRKKKTEKLEPRISKRRKVKANVNYQEPDTDESSISVQEDENEITKDKVINEINVNVIDEDSVNKINEKDVNVVNEENENTINEENENVKNEENINVINEKSETIEETEITYDIINEYKTEMEYSSQKYCITIQFKKDSFYLNEEKVIVITVEKINIIERLYYEKEMSFSDFKKLGKLFKLPENIEEVYDLIIELLEEKNIIINEIIPDKTLTLFINRKLIGYKKPFSVEIKLMKKIRKTNDLIDILYKTLEGKDKYFKNLEEKNKFLEESNKSFEEKTKSLEESNKALIEKNKILEERNKSLEEKNNFLKEKSIDLLEEKTTNPLIEKYKILEDKNKSLELRRKILEERNKTLEIKNEEYNKKFTITYFTFSTEPSAKKYYFNGNYKRITKDSKIVISSNEQLFYFRKFFDTGFKKSFYETRLYHNDNSSNQSVTVFASTVEPTFYLITSKSNATVYFYNSYNEIVHYYFPLFVSRTQMIVSTDYIPTDIFNILNYPT